MNIKIIHLIVLSLTLAGILLGGETQWMAVGNLHNWYHSAGCEIEVGRTFQVSDQQDGLRWPAVYSDQDCQAAKALWIGTTNYDDPLAGKTFDYKVVHIGPRVLDESNEFIPVTFKMIGRQNHPRVFVDGIPASTLDFLETVDEVDPELPADRLLYNVVNTAIGITMTRKIYAFAQENHSNYMIYDYVFKNTGIIDKDETQVDQTLTGVVFHFQYRYAVSREGGPYGEGTWLPQSIAWGHNTMNDVIYTHPSTGEPFRALISWHGKHSKWGGKGDNIGGPNYLDDGHLGAAQHVGMITLHADGSPLDPSDDPSQPFTTKEVGSDDPWTYNNSQFNPVLMQTEYTTVMTAGRPELSHSARVGDGAADLYGGTPGGYSTAHGFGPYTLAPGDSIHIVMAEAAAGINRDLVYEIGDKWLNEIKPYNLPQGGTTNDADEYKNEWVFSGYDSIIQTFERAEDNYDAGLNIPMPPPPPEQFEVNSGGDRIFLNWESNAESWPNFNGYRIYRAPFVPDTTYEKIFECGPGTDHPTIVTEFADTSPSRGVDYYYYLVSYDDGSTNDYFPGKPLESSKFYTLTSAPAFLKRPAGSRLDDIRIVPNPYNIRAREIQFGTDAGEDRLMFYNIPPFCTIKIYTERGDLIKTIEHTDGSGDEEWKSITSSNQVVVSGVYIAYIEVTQNSSDPEFRVGESVIKKFIIVR